MKILVSNDDGIHSKGINVLAKALRGAGHDVTIVAPDRNKSAASSNLTLVDPLRVQKLGEQDYSVIAGTPADCVHLALNGLFENEDFDLVVSGINHGANLGDDVIYSGTVAAALEGRHLDVTSIAVSLVEKNDSTYLSKGEHNFETAAKAVLDLLPKINDIVLDRQVLNVNVPNVPYEELKGVQVTFCGHRSATANVIKDKDPRDATIYWIGPSGEAVGTGEGTDFYAVMNNFVSVTPVQADMTAHQSINQLKEIL